MSAPAHVFHDDPTKPVTLTLPDYRARLAAYRAVSTAEAGSLEGTVSTWETVSVVVDAYLQALQDQQAKVSVYDQPSGRFVPEGDRWRDLARNEAACGCSNPGCECGGRR